MLIVTWFLLIVSIVANVNTSYCGCKVIKPCYETMLDNLTELSSEAMCIEDASMGMGTIKIYLTALVKYCPELVRVGAKERTYNNGSLYEVVIGPDEDDYKHYRQHKVNEITPKKKPVIIIEAGQEGGEESVGLALFWIQQLMACHENEELIKNVKWVILPSTNPDALEHMKHFRNSNWKKNWRTLDGKKGYGVDLTRNFNSHWRDCEKVNSGYLPTYPGPEPSSETETVFIENILQKYKADTKIYLSIKGDGHYIGFPFAYSSIDAADKNYFTKIAAEVAWRVNQRSAGVHYFLNDTIFALRGKPHCGHSVDYAYDIGIPFSFEMRVFLGKDNEITSMFQTLPRGHDKSLRNGYAAGIKELYNVLNNKKKYGDLFTTRKPRVHYRKKYA